MTNDSTWITLPKLAALLTQLCQQRCTATLIGVTEHSDSLVVAMQDGSIVGLSFKVTGGRAALTAIQGMSRCKASIKNKLMMRTDADLPVTAEILQALGAVEGVDLSPPTTVDDEVRLLSGTAMRAVIEKEASKLFGPVASMLVKEQLAHGLRLHTQDDLRQLLHAVAVAAGEPGLASQLIARVMDASNLEPRTVTCS